MGCGQSVHYGNTGGSILMNNQPQGSQVDGVRANEKRALND